LTESLGVGVVGGHRPQDADQGNLPRWRRGGKRRHEKVKGKDNQGFLFSFFWQ
jgi:hypothetical protein